MRQAKEIVKIIVVCIGAAVLYGILHDLVTAHLCVEYFSKAHPRIIASESPVALALLWGVIATWWMGAGVGVPLALVCRVGKWPKLHARDLYRPILALLACMAILAVLGGLAGYVLSVNRLLQANENLSQRIPAEHINRFFAVGGAHATSYAVGAIGGVFIIGWALGWRNAAGRSRRTTPVQ